MTDIPKRFPYGGGPARAPRWVNPRLAAARAAAVGAELAELPDGSDAYAEPSYDEPIDDGAPSLPSPPPDRDLDFNAGFTEAESPASRAAPEAIGISAAAHLANDEFTYSGWECDCKVTAKTGIPARHYRQYVSEDSRYLIMIAPGRGDIKQAKGEAQSVEDSDDDAVVPVECPSWRVVVRAWRRPVRDWSRGKHGIKPAAPEPGMAAPLPPPLHRAGPIGEPTFLEVTDLPPRCTAKSIMLSPGVTSRFKVIGRQVDDGPVVTRFRVAGTAGGRAWVAYWTEGKFASAQIDRRSVNLAELRASLRGESA